ncbi:MAG: AlpA family phage regulatory protein [Pseudomonadota bacterium]
MDHGRLQGATALPRETVASIEAITAALSNLNATPVGRPDVVVLKLHEVQMRTGLKRSSVYGRLSPKSSQYDPTFPKSIRLSPARGDGTSRRAAVGWIEAEIDEWLTQRMNDRPA